MWKVNTDLIEIHGGYIKSIALKDPIASFYSYSSGNTTLVCWLYVYAFSVWWPFANTANYSQL